jgi:hypothetical protein
MAHKPGELEAEQPKPVGTSTRCDGSGSGRSFTAAPPDAAIGRQNESPYWQISARSPGRLFLASAWELSAEPGQLLNRTILAITGNDPSGNDREAPIWQKSARGPAVSRLGRQICHLTGSTSRTQTQERAVDVDRAAAPRRMTGGRTLRHEQGRPSAYARTAKSPPPQPRPRSPLSAQILGNRPTKFDGAAF